MRETITEVIGDVCSKLFGVDAIVELERPEEQFGDFSTNVAMRLSKPLNQNPRDIAQQIASELRGNTAFKSVGVAGPGFINFTLTDGELLSSLDLSPAQYLKGMKVLVEYSDPNPFKPLHAGHLYTTLVGDVIAKLVEQAGADTVRLNYGGDVGLHVAKTMWSIEKFLGSDDFEVIKSLPEIEKGKWMGERYAEGHKAYEDDDQSKSEIVVLNKKIYELITNNDKDSQLAQIYWYLRAESYKLFEQLYERLQVAAFDRYIPESEVTPLGVDTVTEQTAKGVFERSDGAIIFDGEKYGLHKRVFINSEGLPTYETKDVGNSLTKWRDYKYDESIIITANEQAQYMQVVIKAIEQFAPEPAQRTKHLTHGLLKMQGGVKMSSRKGNVLMASDILDAAEVAGKASGLASQAEVVLGAIKYAFVKNRMGGDVIYNPEESAAMDGNSGPYLQYAHARACSIIRKAAKAPSDETATDGYKLNTNERSLVRKLSMYAETVDQASRELAPHVICTYIYELAQIFNRFYESNKVIGTEQEVQRVGLVIRYQKTLKNGLSLLGISAPESM